MAEAVVEERQLLKALRWYDGFVVALANPGFLIGSLGFSIGVLGGWGAVILWTISMAIGVLSNWIYSESAAMFPDKPGGIALYAHEGWRRYFSLIGPIATFGYWFAWSSVLALFGVLIGTLVQTEWFPGEDWTFSTGLADNLGLPHVIAVVVIVLVWLFNIFGVRPSVWVAYATGALLMIPLAVFIVLPYLTGDWESANMTWEVPDWKTAVVWLYIMGWSAYGVETCAAFAPEYKETVRDTTLALRSAALFSLAVYFLLPLGLTGTTGQQAAVDNPAGFYVGAFDQIVGGAGDLMVALLIASLLLSMNTATADGSRALYGIARDGMTVRELFHLNRFHVPARAMTVDLLVNILLVFFVGNILAILVAGNLGYMSAHFFALTGFILLRRDRPAWPRPIRLPSAWVAIAALLAAANAFFIIVGASNPSLTGYGGRKETWVGIGVLLFSIVLFFFRRSVQDHKPIALREETPELPPATQPTPEGAAAAAPSH
ncbi:MAG: APC family permease [Actinomycetota bacterium]|nr:APC family permease [Actinomycetota bacterium]